MAQLTELQVRVEGEDVLCADLRQCFESVRLVHLFNNATLTHVQFKSKPEQEWTQLSFLFNGGWSVVVEKDRDTIKIIQCMPRHSEGRKYSPTGDIWFAINHRRSYVKEEGSNGCHIYTAADKLFNDIPALLLRHIS